VPGAALAFGGVKEETIDQQLARSGVEVVQVAADSPFEVEVAIDAPRRVFVAADRAGDGRLDRI
jgi:hypothetical protein